jgi:hypothetical protein
MKIKKYSFHKTLDDDSARRRILTRRAQPIIDEILASGYDAYTWFEKARDLLVPSSGPAETVAGEIVRALNRIEYRWFNSGDRYYEGYGFETLASPVQFIIETLDTEEVYELFEFFPEDIKENSYTESEMDDRYEKQLMKIIVTIMGILMSKRADLFGERSHMDMFDAGIDIVEEWIPFYSSSVSIPYELSDLIDQGLFHEQDLFELAENNLRNKWGRLSMEHSYGLLEFEGLDVDDYYTVINDFPRWTQGWLEEARAIAGIEDDDY